MGIGYQTIVATLPVAYFVAAWIITVWRRKPEPAPPVTEQQDEADSTDNDNKLAAKEDAPPKTPRLQQTLLITTALVIALSIAESAFQAPLVGGFRQEADDRLLADLFNIFTYAVLEVSFSSVEQVNYMHYGGFGLAAVASCVRLADRASTKTRGNGKIVIGLIAAQILFSLGISALSVVSASLPPLIIEVTPETEPLLSDAKSPKKGKNKKEETEDDKLRKKLRDRPVLQYLKSFHVFLSFMWPSTTRQKLHFIGMLACSGLERVIGILQPLVLGKVVNDLAQAWAIPWKSFSFYIILNVLNSRIGISMVEDVLYLYLRTQQELSMKRAAYDHILNLSADFHDSKTTTHVYSAMYHARSVIALCHDAVFNIGPSMFDLVAGFVVLYVLFGDYMGLLVLTTIVLFLWTTANALQPRADLYRKNEDAWYDEIYQMVDSTQNWYTVSEFSQIPYEKGQFRERGQASQDINISIWWYNTRSSSMRYSITTLAFVFAVLLAVVQIVEGDQKVGAFVTLTAYWAQLTAPLGQLVGEINSASEKLVRAEKLLVLLEKKPMIKDAPQARPYEFRGGAVEFEDVHFTYDGKRQASEGVTFRADPGSMTALVGETGGGKSTILKLLFRFYDPQQGKVLIDGQDLKELQLSSFRKHIGWVPQDAVPFNKTILDNVKYPNLEVDDATVEEACKNAALHDKIMTFTKKYQEKVGERGTKLSGGERQRLAIARAILQNPDILLLDEATSSVDSLTEAQIQESLENLGKRKTKFVIAHRLSTILKADQILVIDKGKMVESGKHADLIKKDGVYKKLWESQLKLQTIDESAAGSPDGPVNLMDDVAESKDDAAESKNSEAKDERSESKRGRKSARESLKSLGRRLSSSRSTKRKVSHDDKSTNGHVNQQVSPSASPSRSRLKASAPEFVPKTTAQEQKEGKAEETAAEPSMTMNFNGEHDRRQTKSESALPEREESGEDESKDES